MQLDYEARKLTQEQRQEHRELDEHYIEQFQELYEVHERLGNKKEANRCYWVLGLIDRLQETAYEWAEAQEDIEELKRYIEDWQVRPNLGKHFDARY